MPNNLQIYTQLADDTAKQITGSYRDWTAFLTTAARLYKYPYHEQIMIYAQRPDATACADFDLWNKTMRRYVRRGSKGIALVDDSGETPRLRYVFDISDTGGKENSRRPFLWEYQPEHNHAVSFELERNFLVGGNDGIDRQLEEIAAQLADEYWNDHKRDLIDIVDGSFLEEYDEFNIGVQFRNAATVSIAYSLMSRCGLEPEEYFEHEDFLSIFDFNTPATMTFLGTAVSDANQQVLRQIEIAIKNYERSKEYERPDLHEERGLSDTRPDHSADGDRALGQIRTDAEELSQGASDGILQPSASEREAERAPDGDRPDGGAALGADDAGAGADSGRDGEHESQRPDEVDGADEQSESASGGDHSDGVGPQLSLFPSETEQIQRIDEAEEITSSAFSIGQEDIDAELRRGSGYEGGKLRIYAAFQNAADQKERIAFLKGEYNYYGHSHTYLDGSGGFVDYAPGKGMELASRGFTDKVTFSYAKMATRIAELIAADNYLTAEEKARYSEIERDYAGSAVPTPSPRMAFPAPAPAPEPEPISVHYADIRNDAHEIIDSGYIAHDPKTGFRVLDETEEGAIRRLQERIATTEPVIEAVPAPPRSITQGDIDAAIQAWNGDIKSKHTVVRHMSTHARDRETAAFLRNEFGGDLAAFPVTADGAHNVPWTQVQRRIYQLIQADRFYTQEEQDNHDDIDPIAIREGLAERGIVNGEVVDPVAFENSPFIQQVTADVERLEAEEQTAAPELDFDTVAQTVLGRVMLDEDYLADLRDAKTRASMRNTCAWALEQSIRDHEQDEPDIFHKYFSDYDWRERLLQYVQRESYANRPVPQQAEEQISAPEPELSQAEQSGSPPPVFFVDWETAQFDFDLSRYNDGDIIGYNKDGVQYALGRSGDFTYVTSTGMFWGSNTVPGNIYEQINAYRNGDLTDEQVREIYLVTLGITSPSLAVMAQNFRITDDYLGAGGQKAKYHMNVEAIRTLQQIEAEGRSPTPEEQEVLSRYVGWGGLPDAFDPEKPAWASEYKELSELLSPGEYESARESTLNAHYTSPTVIKAIYEAVEKMGFRTGNILEPACGVGNFFGLLPESMAHSKLYGTELDSITGRIAKHLYPNADIQVAGFETTDRRDFYDLAVGNVPFGQYKVADKPYDKLGFSIHDYFFAKSIDQVRPGGVIAFVTSRYTMDKKSPEVRRYIAERAELLGAIRLPNNAFKANAGTEVVSDIIFLQKRDRPIVAEPDWVHLGTTEDGFNINSYFVEHPEMVLGVETEESTQYGRQDYTVAPIEGADLAEQLREAVSHINGEITEAELPDLGEGETIDSSIPADPNVKNYSYTIVDGEVYYRENSRMVSPELNATATERVKGMVELRDCVQSLIGQQLDSYISDATIRETQVELNRLYDDFTAKYGLINSRGNSLAFADDNSYYLLCSLEVLDEDGNLERKADMFTKRTIRQNQVVTSVDTASEALAVSISEKACVDLDYMSELSGLSRERLLEDLRGVVFLNVGSAGSQSEAYVTADEYLSGNIREKLRQAKAAADTLPSLSINVQALKAAMPKDLDASEIDVRLGATWIDKEYIREFMYETFQTPRHQRGVIDVNYMAFTAEWNIKGKSAVSWNDVAAFTTYGTSRASAYRILEDTLNLRDIRIYDTVTDPDGKERRVLNKNETTLAQQKQQTIKDAFRDWIFKDPERRQALVREYNDKFNSVRPREYDGSHLTLTGMNPEIVMRQHQLNAVAHEIYGGNTLLAHEVGSGKTFEMVAAAMESKRLGLCTKSLFAVPNHLIEQWASEFLRLYPSANILVATKKDFETRNRKKFCSRIATGDYDAVIVGHSQFERIPVSKERQERLLQEQIWEIEDGLEELKNSRAENFTIKQLERTKKNLQARLSKLNDTGRKDDVITFEQLGVDRLFVDEAHSYKNLFLYTKMRNVAGLSTSEAQKSSDMLLKCRYMDEKTDGKGVIFATGTPVSNSMTELFTMQRYLQHDTLQRSNLNHFDCWASTFGETVTAIELAPEGTGYRARTRFAKFFNLPELMNMFKETADIKTADQLDLPRPDAVFHNVVAQPTEHQKEMVQELSERAKEVHTGTVDPSRDNMLKITSDGRKLGLDQRIINPMLPDDPASKVNMCVDNIMQIWQDGQEDKLTQLVFCDISTPKARAAANQDKAARLAGDKTIGGAELHALNDLMGDIETEPPFSVYEDVRAKLIERGIPAEQVAFIHEANTETRKKELFAKVRSGQVRVLMGSTFKMGSGMNVQDRLIALHDLDAPWRPGDLEQRAGRIIRQGNMNPEVHIYRYVTEGTFDSYLWQTLENKQKFISQIMTSKSPVRSCEDVDETALSYAEIKALCAGNPQIKEKMDLDIDVARLKLLKANHQSQQYKLEDNLLKHFPEQIEANKGYIAGFEADMATLAAHPLPQEGFTGMTVKGDALTDKDNAGAAILEACKEVKDDKPVEIGSYRGFTMSLSVEGFVREHILTLKGQMSHRVNLGKDARGNLTRIDNALAQMPERLQSVQTRLENLYNQVEAAKAELGKPFPQESELAQKSARLSELDALLNMSEQAAPAPERMVSKSERPSVLASLKVPSRPGNPNRQARPEREAR